MRQKLTYTLRLLDPQGRILKSRTRPARSFLVAYLQHIKVLLSVVSAVIVNNSGANTTVPHPTAGGNYFLRANGALNVQSYGPVVGSGVAAESNEDYALASQIPTGNGAGELEHQLTAVDEVVHDATTSTLKIRRNFNNNSGGLITITEIGIYVWTHKAGFVVDYYCIIRDLLATPFNIPDGTAIQVEYTLQTTV